jgi:hypothetical protein
VYKEKNIKSFESLLKMPLKSRAFFSSRAIFLAATVTFPMEGVAGNSKDVHVEGF